MDKKILVTGGAGYIGSFMSRRLRDEDYDVVILDNLICGHIDAVKDFRLEKIDLVDDSNKLKNLFKNERFDGVIHMASFIQMAESFKNPSKYYRNNVLGFLNLLDSMIENNCNKLILSSSAGVYGNPVRLPIEEDDSKNPLNPYGETKYILERMLDDYDDAYNLKSVSLRYFNAAGASLDGLLGEDHVEESHLIPNVIKKALSSEAVEIFGDDYDTPDGTCVRDYIHVLDLVDAHTLALNSLLNGMDSKIYNLGIGRGYSNREVVAEIEKVSKIKIAVKYGPRREGDAGSLFASNLKISKDLGWSPKYNLNKIVESAYLWHKTHPQGYVVAK